MSTSDIQKFSLSLLKSQTDLIKSNPSLLGTDALSKSHLSLMATAALESLSLEPLPTTSSGKLSRDILTYMLSQSKQNQEVPPLPDSSKAQFISFMAGSLSTSLSTL